MKRDEDTGAWVMFATGPEEDTIYKDDKTYTGGERALLLPSVLTFLFLLLLLFECDHPNNRTQCSLIMS